MPETRIIEQVPRKRRFNRRISHAYLPYTVVILLLVLDTKWYPKLSTFTLIIAPTMALFVDYAPRPKQEISQAAAFLDGLRQLGQNTSSVVDSNYHDEEDHDDYYDYDYHHNYPSFFSLFVSSKIGIADNGIGLIALEDIAENEIVLSIPSFLEIKGGGSGGFADAFDHGSNPIVPTTCETAWNLVDKYMKSQKRQELVLQRQQEAYYWQEDDEDEDEIDEHDNDPNEVAARHFYYWMYEYPKFLMSPILPETDDDNDNITNDEDDPNDYKIKHHVPSPLQAEQIVTLDWSIEAKRAMHQILGKELEPRHFAGDVNHHQGVGTDCDPPSTSSEHYLWESSKAQALLPHAVQVVTTRGWSSNMLIPIHDMMERSIPQYNIQLNETSKFHPHPNEEDNDNDDRNRRHDSQFYATRFIPKGHHLYAPYGTVSSFFSLYGIVHPYPRRWQFDTGYDFDHNHMAALIFEIHQEADQPREEDDENDETTTTSDSTTPVTVKWVTGLPNAAQLNWLTSHTKRLEQEIQPQLWEHILAPVSVATEKQAIWNYFQALLEDMKQAILWAKGNPYHPDEAFPTTMTTTTDSSTNATQDCSHHHNDDSYDYDDDFYYYDNLQSKPDRLDYDMGSHSSCLDPRRAWGHIDDFRTTNYQNIKWVDYPMDRRRTSNDRPPSYDDPETTRTRTMQEDEPDKCLYLSNSIHSCFSFRAHVHEPIVHYPASFVPENGVKRVLYVGGGDLILLHEILKYQSLELVIGMELDQEMVRSTFRHYGVQPHFDDPRVHWWFGDAAKSLRALSPDKYFGTFDLVIIDLETHVIFGLEVAGEKLTDYMMKLVKPDTGILVRQEDYLMHYNVEFAQYTADYTIQGLPYLCQQAFVMGSHGIDFSKTKPRDHGIDTIFYGPAVKSYNDTAIWSSFRTNHDHNNVHVSNRQTKQSQDDTIMSSFSRSRETEPDPNQFGTLIVMEVEQSSINLENHSLVLSNVKQAIVSSMGLTIHHIVEQSNRTTTTNKIHKGQRSDDYYSFFLFMGNSGYMIVRVWLFHHYCAVDMQLWNIENMNLQEFAIQEIVAALGGSLWNHSTSSYQITTGGMYGLSVVANEKDDRGSHDKQQPQSRKSQEKEYWKTAKSSSDSSLLMDSTAKRSLTKQNFYTVVQQMSTSLVHSETPVFVVLCGDAAAPCPSLDALRKVNGEKDTDVIPIWQCPSLTAESKNQSDFLLSDMLDCERQLRQSLHDKIISNRSSYSKIDGIWIDANVPREMGQILHKVFNNTYSRQQFISETFIIVAPLLTTAVNSTTFDKEGYYLDESWKHVLLERFRTEIIQFNPVFHSNIVVGTANNNNDGVDGDDQDQICKQTEKDQSLQIELFSAGDEYYHANLLDYLTQIRQQTQLDAEIQSSHSGMMAYIPDFEANQVLSMRDYDMGASMVQWLNQNPIGHQTILQFEIQPSTPIGKGDRIMLSQGSKYWVPGIVNQYKEPDIGGRILGAYDIQLDRGLLTGLGRAMIRKVDEYNSTPFRFGELVLFQRDEGDRLFVEGLVVHIFSNNANNNSQAIGHDCQILDLINFNFHSSKHDDLIRLAADRILTPTEPVHLSKTELKNIVLQVLALMDSPVLPDVDELIEDFILDQDSDEEFEDDEDETMDEDGDEDDENEVVDEDENEMDDEETVEEVELMWVDDVGDGSILTIFFTNGQGSLVVSWDGRSHLDVNLFRLDSPAAVGIQQQEKEDISFAEDETNQFRLEEFAEMLEFYLQFYPKLSDLKQVQMDSQPRGYGRVVNFPDDIESEKSWFGEKAVFAA